MAKGNLPGAYVGLEAFNLVLNYLYTGRLKPAPADVSTCVDGQCLHRACWPAVDFSVQLMYASTAFQIKELMLLLKESNFTLDHVFALSWSSVMASRRHSTRTLTACRLLPCLHWPPPPPLPPLPPPGGSLRKNTFKYMGY
ncbi:hypothetical protein SAY86_027836 [Trapa natans]|uniref:C2HC NPR-type domain-containing protein n=1 Tax=Trapa natans TaxID=22666 RepID=A0AAN7LYQ8_TRANT|nr:hypothetical protein SAY86_027836 [Trapa natans]